MKHTFRMSEYFGSSLTDQDKANRFRLTEIETRFSNTDQLIFDFSGIETMTDSFAAACFQDLFKQRSFAEVVRKIRLENCSPPILECLRLAFTYVKWLATLDRYLINNPEGLDIMFYDEHDTGFLLNTSTVLMLIATNEDHFKEFANNLNWETNGMDKKFFEGLRAHVHFLMFQQFEALFALLMATFQELPHWLYLTTYRTEELRDKIRKYVSGDLREMTNCQIETDADFLKLAVYSDFQSSDPETAKRWNENLETISKVLKGIAERYLNAGEYNSYKHGTRVLTGPAELYIAPDGMPDQAVVLNKSEDSLSYLELEKLQDSRKKRVFLATKGFSPVESFNCLIVMQGLARMIKHTRLARRTGKKELDLQMLFPDMKKLTELKTYGEWRFSL